MPRQLARDKQEPNPEPEPAGCFCTSCFLTCSNCCFASTPESNGRKTRPRWRPTVSPGTWTTDKRPCRTKLRVSFKLPLDSNEMPRPYQWMLSWHRMRYMAPSTTDTITTLKVAASCYGLLFFSWIWVLSQGGGNSFRFQMLIGVSTKASGFYLESIEGTLCADCHST